MDTRAFFQTRLKTILTSKAVINKNINIKVLISLKRLFGIYIKIPYTWFEYEDVVIVCELRVLIINRI